MDKSGSTCRPGCAACCIVISISSPLPGMPNGKPAGVPCIHLDEKKYCKLHNKDNYPDVCKNFTYDPEFCGSLHSEAFERLSILEMLTSNEQKEL